MSKTVHTIVPPGFGTNPSFSPVAIVTGPAKMIYTAGQIGIDEHGKIPESYEEQVDLAFDNLKKCIEAAGAKMRDVAKLTYYIVGYDPKNPRLLATRARVFGEHRPPLTLIPVIGLALEGILFEVEAVAATSDVQQSA